MLKMLTRPEMYLENCDVSMEVQCLVLTTPIKKYRDDNTLSERNLTRNNAVLEQILWEADTQARVNVRGLY